MAVGPDSGAAGRGGRVARKVPKGGAADRLAGFLLGLVLLFPGVPVAFFGARLLRRGFPPSAETAAKWAAYGIAAALVAASFAHPGDTAHVMAPYALLLSLAFGDPEP